jgi:small conductance mechanosensitive channel
VAARDLALRTLVDLPFIIETPAPNVWVHELGDSTIILRCAGWIKQHETSLVLAKGEAIRILLDVMENAGFEMPKPTIRVITDGGDRPAKSQTPEKKRPAFPEARGAENVSAERALEDIIALERKELHESDLLNRKAPEE